MATSVSSARRAKAPPSRSRFPAAQLPESHAAPRSYRGAAGYNGNVIPRCVPFMQLVAVGINHTTAPVSLREKVAFPADQIGQAVASARSWYGNRAPKMYSDEAAILSTCNRTELYAASHLPGGVNE